MEPPGRARGGPQVMLHSGEANARSKNRPAGAADASRRNCFLLLIALVAVQYLFGGGSRDDIVSLMLLRPLNAVVLALGLYWGWRRAWSSSRPLLLLALATIVLTLSHVIPLPPEIWTALPGRYIVADVFRAAGMPFPWQPISLAQIRSWNALFFLTGPFAALVLAANIDSRRQFSVLRTIIAFGLLSGVLGLLQAIGPTMGPLYFYRITNFGDGVGLFANRNHQAFFMAALFPFLAAHLSLWEGSAEKLAFQKILTAALAIFLVPLIMVSGSRAGLIAGILALGLAAWVFSEPKAIGRRGNTALSKQVVQRIGLIAAMVGIVVLTLVATRATSLVRLFGSDPSNEIRIQALATNLEIVWTFFPFGSGIGSFVEVYRYFEPDDLLGPRYLNHAHNDFLEVAMTAGLPGLILMTAAGALGAICALRLIRVRLADLSASARYDVTLGRAGLSALFLLVLGSVTDYPLRVPSLAVLAAISATWALRGFAACTESARCQHDTSEVRPHGDIRN